MISASCCAIKTKSLGSVFPGLFCTHSVARAMISPVARMALDSSWTTWPPSGTSPSQSRKTWISSKKAGTRDIKFLTEKPGVNMLLHIFQTWPSWVTRSLDPEKMWNSSRIWLCFGLELSWVNCAMISGWKTASIGWEKGHVSS